MVLKAVVTAQVAMTEAEMMECLLALQERYERLDKMVSSTRRSQCAQSNVYVDTRNMHLTKMLDITHLYRRVQTKFSECFRNPQTKVAKTETT